jgi:hypothetical protein
MWFLSHFGVDLRLVITIGGSLPGFLGATCSGRVFSALAMSVSMSVVLRCAKKLRVNSCGCREHFSRLLGCLGGIIKRYASCVTLLLGTRRPGQLISLRFCSLHHFFLPEHSPSGRSPVHSVLYML